MTVFTSLVDCPANVTVATKAMHLTLGRMHEMQRVARCSPV